MEQKNYSSILDKIRTILGMESVVELDEVVEPVPVETELEPVDTKLAEATLEDGTIIYYDGEMLGVEIAVYTDEIMEVVVIDGDYVLENGDTFSIVNGVISEYIPIVVEETEPEPEEEALEEINFEEKYNDLMIVVDELKQQLEKFNKQEIELKAEIEKMSAEPEVESIAQAPQATIELTAIEKRLAALDAIRKLGQK